MSWARRGLLYPPRKKKSEKKSLSKASHLLTRVRKFIYSLVSLVTPALGFLMKLWGNNDSILGIKNRYPGNFNQRSPPPPPPPQCIVARQQVWQTPDILHVCVCVRERAYVCVWYFWWGNRQGCRSGCAQKNLGVILLIWTWGVFSFLFLIKSSPLFLSSKQPLCPPLLSCDHSALQGPVSGIPPQRQPLWG